MPELPSGVVAFLFADLESASGGWDTNYQQTAARVDKMVEVLKEIAHAHDGAVFKVIGESAQAAFPDVSRALGAALAAQLSFTGLWPADQLPRMAIQVGEATPRNGDYLAPALNRLARLTSASHAGQILLTEAARMRLGGSARRSGTHKSRPPSAAGLAGGRTSLSGLRTQPANRISHRCGAWTAAHTTCQFSPRAS